MNASSKGYLFTYVGSIAAILVVFTFVLASYSSAFRFIYQDICSGSAQCSSPLIGNGLPANGLGELIRTIVIALVVLLLLTSTVVYFLLDLSGLKHKALTTSALLLIFMGLVPIIIGGGLILKYRLQSLLILALAWSIIVPFLSRFFATRSNLSKKQSSRTNLATKVHDHPSTE